MNSTTIAAPAKINLALDVLYKREDGYHEMRMLNHSASLYDYLTISPSAHYVLSGDVSGEIDNNLITRAAHALDEATGCGTDFRIDVVKNIPERAGLAGGSSDAAAALRLITDFKRLNLSEERLREIALSLGADVPFCLYNQLSLVEGIGEIVTPVRTPFQAELLILSPGIEIKTPEAFTWLEESKIAHTDFDALFKILKERDYTRLSDCAFNSFLAPISERNPEILSLIHALYNSGAFFVTMSGSGASLVAYYDEAAKRDRAARDFSAYQVYKARSI